MSENPIIQIFGGIYDPLTNEISFSGGKKIMVVPNGVEVVTGPPGPRGPKGDNGLSAYDIAFENGTFTDSEEDWNSRVNDLSGFASSAEQSATSASSAQTAAQSAESTATTKASEAATSATTAQTAATLATTYSLPHVTLSAVDYAALSPPVTGVLYITTSGVTL